MSTKSIESGNAGPGEVGTVNAGTRTGWWGGHAARIGSVVSAALLAALLGSCSGGDAAGGESPRDDQGARTAEAATVPSGGEDLRPTSSRWIVLEGAETMDGAGIELAREASRGANSTGIAPTLHLRCQGDETDVIIVWYEDPEGSDNDVTTQIGSAEPVRRTWTNLNENATVFPRDSATTFIRRLMEADSLTARTNLYKRMPVSVVFDLTGLSESVAPLREACSF